MTTSPSRSETPNPGPEPGPATAGNAAGSLWQQRTFLRIWGGQAISMQGDGLHQIAVFWWIKDNAGSPGAAALVMLVFVLTDVLLGPLAGAVVDRFDRRRLMMLADLGRALVTAVLAWGMISGWVNLTLIAAGSVLLALGRAFHRPALRASIPLLVPRPLLTRANALHQSAFSASQLIAPIAGGILVAQVGAGMAVALDTLTYLVAAATLVRVTIPRPVADPAPAAPAAAPVAAVPSTAATAAASPSATAATAATPAATAAPSPFKRFLAGLLADVGEGLRYLRVEQPMLFFAVITFSLVNFALIPMEPLLPFLAEERLGVGPEGYGTLVAGLPVGALVGTALMSRYGDRIRRGLGIIWSIAALGFAMALMALAPSFPAAVAAMAVMGLILSVTQILVSTLFQTRVPANRQGRVFGILGSMTSAAMPLALMLTSLISPMLPPHLIIAGGGILAALAGLAGYLVPGFPQAE